MSSNVKKRGKMPLWAKALIWLGVSLATGVAGGQFAALEYEAPFYFGFFLGFVLLGLAGLFALAVHVAETQK